MKTIVLLSCCKQKLNETAPAEKLYQSTGFKKSLAYAKSLRPDGIFILSAKHHVVKLDDMIEPYDVCLRDKNASEKTEWAKTVVSQLEGLADLKNDKFVILCGSDYCDGILPHITNYELPLKGLSMGYRLQWLDQHTVSEDNLCLELHKFFNDQKRYYFPFNPTELPENGIYVLFEKGETYKGMDRIVRVGTHIGQNNLRSRLEQHFMNENKDRSIFRKNIGRAILNRNEDTFLEQWNLDLTTKKNKEKYSSVIDFNKQKEIEKLVTEYMLENFSFCVIPVDVKEERLKYESFLISTISGCKACRPSDSWLGQHSPVEKIKKSGMWLVNGLSKDLD